MNSATTPLYYIADFIQWRLYQLYDDMASAAYKLVAELNPPFARTGDSFEDRVGELDRFTWSLGQVVLSFSLLESNLTDAVHRLLNCREQDAEILTAEMSFKNLVHTTASLAKDRLASSEDTLALDLEEDVIDLIVARCFEAEQLRNRVMHSIWVWRVQEGGHMLRRKTTAKASKGLRTDAESVSPEHMMDIADHIAHAAGLIEEQLLAPELPSAFIE